jgi:methionyl-tRNA formyltransferase
MRIVFAGTPQAAVPTLRALAAGPHRVVLVVTRPDAPQGRRRVLTPSPVADAAAELGLVTMKTARLDAEATRGILETEPDLGVIVAFGGLVREPLLTAPRHGWVNLHFSLLPRWRGAAPVQRAIIAGDDLTGAAVFRLVPELDAGDVYDTVHHPIGDDDTAQNVLEELADDGAHLVARVVDRIADGSAVASPQVGEASYAAKLTLDDGRLDLTVDADTVFARQRGVTPEPGAFFQVGDTRVKVLAAARSAAERLPPGVLALHGARALVGTGTSPLELVTVQPAGKRAMPGADWLRGLPAGATAQATMTQATTARTTTEQAGDQV